MAEKLHDLIIRVGNLVDGSLRHAASEAGLKLVQLKALQYLATAEEDADTPAAVAEHLDLTKGTVSQTLTTLETKGLLKKKADSEDNRKVHCKLTRKGKRIAEKTRPAPLLKDVDVPRGLERSLERLLDQMTAEPE